jgi:hypothetical protein
MDIIKNIADENMSIIKVMVMFYTLNLLTTSPLLSKQMTEFMGQNRMAQHMMGLITLVVLITLTQQNLSYAQIFMYTMICYIWFLFMTKMDIQLNILVLLILVSLYMYDYSIKSKKIKMNGDPVLSNDEVNKINKKNVYSKYYALLLLMAITFIFTSMYSQKKHEQYGGGYSMTKFLLN